MKKLTPRQRRAFRSKIDKITANTKQKPKPRTDTIQDQPPSTTPHLKQTPKTTRKNKQHQDLDNIPANSPEDIDKDWIESQR